MTTAALTAPMRIRTQRWAMLPSAVAAASLGIVGVALIGFALALPIALGQAESGQLQVSGSELVAARGLAGLWPILLVGAVLHAVGAIGAIARSATGRMLAVVAATLGGSAVLLGLASMTPSGTALTALLPICAIYVVAILAAIAIRAPAIEVFDDSRMPW